MKNCICFIVNCNISNYKIKFYDENNKLLIDKKVVGRRFKIACLISNTIFIEITPINSKGLSPTKITQKININLCDKNYNTLYINGKFNVLNKKQILYVYDKTYNFKINGILYFRKL